MPPVYQMHSPEQKAMSNSYNKLDRLHLPQDMSGLRFLDVGCNEGFFCNVALQRGASSVVGIDFYEPSLITARELYPDPRIDFRLQSWANLPDEQFDIILWSSSMHYELDPAAVLRNMLNRLSPEGLLVLECGIFEGGGFEMVRVNRHSDSRWYPTEPLLVEKFLAPFSARQVAWPETTEGDPVPRSVFHCWRRLPSVVLLRGRSRDGKSTAAQSLKTGATKIIPLDLFLWRIWNAEFHPTKLDRYVKENFKGDQLTELYEGIDEESLTYEFAAILAAAIAPSDTTVVIDGAMTDAQATALSKSLRGKAAVWDASRRR